MSEIIQSKSLLGEKSLSGSLTKSCITHEHSRLYSSSLEGKMSLQVYNLKYVLQFGLFSNRTLSSHVDVLR